ncbi:MAG: hypothetical protein ACR2ML_02060 [Solirubrobacteraceae bacterium]
MISRWPKRGLVLASLAVIAILVATVVDYQLTVDRLPEVGVFTEEHPASSSPAVAEQERLRDAFVTRGWCYSLVFIGTVTALVVAGLRSAPRDRWHELFTDLGVASVPAIVLASVLSSSWPNLLEEVSKELIWLPPVLMVLGAGVGSLLTLSKDRARAAVGAPAIGEPGPPTPDPTGRSLYSPFPRIGRITIGLSVLTVVLLAILGAGVHGAECSDRARGWVGLVALAALGSGLAVGVCGVLALFARRWVLCLLSISFAAIALLFAVAGAIGDCLS